MSNPQIADQQITSNQVQNLKSAERIVGFFDMLGYPVGDRIEMTPEALNFSDDLSESVQRIEKISSVDEMLEVYLVELLSLTVARRKALARAFRDFPMEFLFVLTDDYKQIDFMLLERTIPTYKEFGIGKRKALIHQHAFSVDRSDPDQVALRVLRRLSFTAFDQQGERDPLGQYDKLKSAFTTARWSEPYFNNRALFSDYYLTERIPEHPSWEAEDRHQAFRAIRDVYASAGSLAGKDHQSLQGELIAPVMEELGFFAGSLDSQEGPDLNLFAEAGARGEQLAFALCYPWNRYLDGRDAGGTDPERGDENPGAVMVGLLEEGTASWGILTNGKIWRLYSAGAHSRATNYYEIDLEETLASPDPGKAFRYFYLFFRAEAFIPQEQNLSGETRELSFLDLVLEESDLYARQLGDRLKDTVFEEVFPYFAEGFIEGMGGTETLLELTEEEREEKLELVYRGTLTFLYRLLFLLYAESRDLLPVREVRGYYKNSLQRIKEDIAARAGDIEDLAPENIRKAFRKTETGLYDRFSKLCRIVDEGSPAKNVPVYNGGLFLTDPEQARSQRDKEISRFLLDYPIPDQFFALGLDKMARDIDPKKHSLGFIDYKSLGVRQLGSIYEGLLEFKVRVAAEKMAVVEGKKTEEIVPYRQAKQEDLDILTDGRGQNAKERGIPRGEIYLVNDKRERKATGSYYTPDYIVKYIVEHAVGPVLDEKLEDLQPRLQETEQKYRALLKRKREVEGVDPDPYRLLKDNFGDVILELFDIKVLDPAMGSGHFLVEAVDYITDRLVRFLDRYPFLSVFFEGMTETIINELNDQGVVAAPELLTDVNLLKRHVLKRCIYGVDLNPMAVELAKVSLWLDCFTLGAPLSFLDHHLKCGNSLIGAMARELDEGDENDQQMTFLTGPFSGLLRAAEIMRGVSLLTDVTLSQVQESGELFRKYEEKAEPYKKLMDIYVSQHFGVELAREFLTVHDQDQTLQMIKGETDTPNVYINVIDQAKLLNNQKRFFHWDLEFPEIFIDLENTRWKNDGGFDSVIGNPPYERIQTIQSVDPQQADYYCYRYQSATGKFDIYVIFLEKSGDLIANSGRVGLILPHKFTQAHFGHGIRSYLTNNNLLKLYISFGVNQIFSDATTYTCLIFLEMNNEKEISYYQIPNLDSNSTMIRSVLSNLSFPDYKTITKMDFGSKPWIISDLESGNIISKIRDVSLPLDEFVEGIYQGIVTGLNDAFILKNDEPNFPNGEIGKYYSYQIDEFVKIENDLIWPYVKGKDISRFGKISTNHSLLYPYIISNDGAHIIGEDSLKTKYPYTYEYLHSIREHLENRGSENMDYQTWYALWNSRNPENFFQERILVPDIAYGGKMTICTQKRLLHDATTYAITLKRPNKYDINFLLSILNSRLMWFFLTKIGTPLRGGYYRYKTHYLERFPIRKIHFIPSENIGKYNILGNSRKHISNLYSRFKSILPERGDNFILRLSNPPKQHRVTSNFIHDLLSDLTMEMLEMNKKHQEVREIFWNDLQEQKSSDELHLLRKKGKWEKSLAKNKACKPYVDHESRSTKYLDESLNWDEAAFRAFAGMLIGKTSVTPAMFEVYRKYAPEYQQLSNRIEETDDLIDQIVYRLYGLTEEEIEIVESSFDD